MSSGAARTDLLVDEEGPCLEIVATDPRRCHSARRALTALGDWQARAALEREVTDLDFTDVALPGTDGHELVCYLGPGRPGLPVLVGSATPPPAWARNSFGAAAAHFFAKPIEPWLLQAQAAGVVECGCERGLAAS